MGGYGKTDIREVLYTEDIRISWLFLTILAGALGITAAILTMVAFTGAVSGWEAVLFYAAMSLGIAVLVFVIINFTMLSIAVAFEGIEFRYGVLAKRLRFDQMRSAEAKEYEWLRYGGWGLRWSTGGRRAWNMPFLSTGVVITVDEGGREREYYVSSHNPEELARVLRERISSATQPDR